MSDDLWKLTDHACRRCSGRVLVQRRDDGSWRARCADCAFPSRSDYATEALAIDSVCACGTRLGGTNAGFRCRVDPDWSLKTARPEVVTEYVGIGTSL